MSARLASQSTILPLPSSPHWAPMTVTFPTVVPCFLRPLRSYGAAHCASKRQNVVEGAEQKTAVVRIAFPCARPRGRRITNWGVIFMKTTTVLAIALGIGALAACKQSPQEQTADNIEANAENTADTIEAN